MAHVFLAKLGFRSHEKISPRAAHHGNMGGYQAIGIYRVLRDEALSS